MLGGVSQFIVFVLLNLGFRGIETTTDLGWQLGASHLNAIRSQNLIGIFIPNAVLEGLLDVRNDSDRSV